ncbi:MAG: hypothetical protein ACR652_24790 [Methylocystis sp.]|uniref:bestrophin-like domain n=1 Tax=Methylocystis sp. TaxID=1911079 RepID=UPI003DA3C5E4
MTVFENLPFWIIFLTSVCLFAAASEIGHRLGVRDGGEANIATLEASILGLLALMLSFTFAMAVTRFDDRREALLKESNAIGTAALRARLLPAPHNAACVTLLREYIGVRVELAKAISQPAPIEKAISRSNAIQESLWKEAKAVASKDTGMVPTGLFIQALNDVFDAQESRLTAFRLRVPRIVFLALYGIAAVGIGFSGYASGLEKRKWRRPVYIVNLLAASVILLIQDIDRPDSGSVRVDTQPIMDTAEALANDRMDVDPSPARYR